jgi:hypothetical protein
MDTSVLSVEEAVARAISLVEQKLGERA